MKRLENRVAPSPVWLAGFISVMFMLAGGALAQQGEWEMRVCANPDNMPSTGRDQPGFENAIASIIADELGAYLTYEWTPINDQTIANVMRPGRCDVVMGVGDGAGGLISTVAYYRTPYVMVYRNDGPALSGSLEDPALQELRIATYPNSGPHRALVHYGLEDNLQYVEPTGSTRRFNYATPFMEALLAGDIDAALLEGPQAGYFVQQHEDELSIAPVTPEIVPPLLQMFRIATIAVRPGDESLRDRINIALAARWDDVQAVLAEYGVPTQPVPRPSAPTAPPSRMQVGLVAPMPTGSPHITDTVGLAARYGALLADDLASSGPRSGELVLQIKLADSPSIEAARRAAERLVTTEGVVALVGGFGEGQAQVLSEVAAERGVLFFNIGSLDPALRGNGTFNIEASPRQYLDALIGHYGSQDWFIVHDTTDTGQEFQEQAADSIAEAGGTVSASAAVAPGQFIYYDTIEQASGSGASAVLLLLTPQEQEQFLAQYESLGVEAPVALLPDSVSQTRDFMVRLKGAAPAASLGVRAALWEPTLEEDGAADLNARFTGRTARPMDSAGWAAYAAVTILYQAIAESGAGDVQELEEYLLRPDASFEAGKGDPLKFAAQTRQLLQPLYLVRITPGANWGLVVSEQISLAELVEVVPAAQ